MDAGARYMRLTGEENWVEVTMDEEKERKGKDVQQGKYRPQVSKPIINRDTNTSFAYKGIFLWGIQITMWILLWTNMCVRAEDYITLISDPYGFSPIKNVSGVPVTCVTKEFARWGCQPLGAYPDPEIEYRNVSQEIVKEVYQENWPWNTYHWPLWQMENVRYWLKENIAENKKRKNSTKEGIEELLAGTIRGRFCVPYPFALLKCTKWCWYPAEIDQETGRARKIKINCTEARAVSCTEEMPLSSIHRAYWDEKDRESMAFMNIRACDSNLRCQKRPGGCVEGYPIPVGANIIPENMKYLRGQKSQYGGIKDKNGELKLPLTVRVWVKLANVSTWVNGTPPYWQNRINGSKGINGTLWGQLSGMHHLGFNLSQNGKWCNYTGKIKIGQETFSYHYKPNWKCTGNWTQYPVWQVMRDLDMVEHMTGECVQRPQRHNITVDRNQTITGNCSVTNWDGCNCSRSGNYLYNSTTGGLLVIICRNNNTITGIMGTNTNWTTMWRIYRNCSGCENATLDRKETGTLGGVANKNCSLPHKNESNKWTCAPRQRGGKTDSLYIAGGKRFWTREKAQYSCENNIGELDGMLHQQILLQKYQVIKVRAYTYGVIEMPENYAKTRIINRRKRELSHTRKKRGVGLVIMLVIMAIVAAAGASLGVANAIQQSYTKAAVQTLANATAAQQDALEATYAMVQHVAKGVRILEARVARVEAITDRIMLYQELDCWHYHQYCVTSTRADVAKYINWTRFKDNCTWQQWERELQGYDGNLTMLLRESARQTQLAEEQVRRIPDVWESLKEVFDWSGWFSWLKYIPIIVVGLVGCILIRAVICVCQPLVQIYRTLSTPTYQRVTVIMEKRADVAGENQDFGDGLEESDDSKTDQKVTVQKAWGRAWELWQNSPWKEPWKRSLLKMLILPLTMGIWINGRLGEHLKNKKERVDCETWGKGD
uniref:Envelope polyprotein n=1 Tax=Caprine arthritis encephalitis virus TaxID=11660 RepID=A0A1I9KI49_CAEV|nr:envelope polyprotein [Caprine arthritis encephalitis virus]